jgi:hypothetical protein
MYAEVHKIMFGMHMSGSTGYRAAYSSHASAAVRLSRPNSLAVRMLRRLLDMAEVGTI